MRFHMEYIPLPDFRPEGRCYTDTMSWTPPINRRENHDLLQSERFYRLLAQKCNHISRDQAFIFYISLVGLVEEQLRHHGVVRLPHLADVALVEQKPRPGWVGKSFVRMGPKKVLKFYPKERLRRYFAKREAMMR